MPSYHMVAFEEIAAGHLLAAWFGQRAPRQLPMPQRPIAPVALAPAALRPSGPSPRASSIRSRPVITTPACLPLVGAHAYTQMVKPCRCLTGNSGNGGIPSTRPYGPWAASCPTRPGITTTGGTSSRQRWPRLPEANEGGLQPVCYLWHEWAVRSHTPGMEGAAALNIYVRKHDPGLKSLRPRTGRS